MQQQEEIRCTAVKDSLRKILIFQASQDQNNKYDIQNLSSIYELVKPDQESQTLSSILLYDGEIDKEIMPKPYLNELRKSQMAIFANSKASYIDYRRFDEKFKDQQIATSSEYQTMYSDVQAKLLEASKSNDIGNHMLEYVIMLLDF